RNRREPPDEPDLCDQPERHGHVRHRREYRLDLACHRSEWEAGLQRGEYRHQPRVRDSRGQPAGIRAGGQWQHQHRRDVLLTAPPPTQACRSRVAVNEAINRVYVSNGCGDTLLVLDGDAGIMASLNFPGGVGGMAVDPATNRLYVSYFNSLRVLDGLTNQNVD